MEDDRRFMDRALELAAAGWGRVHPNPLVGAVVVRDGAIVGEGWHAEYGGPHAEVAALRAAGETANGSTLYVTLEPCAHHGKTPPCTEAILASGIARVVYGAADPNPEAAGGAAALREHGVAVESLAAAAAVAADPAFHWSHHHDTPWVALKLAASLDGRLSRERDRPTPVTGPEANAFTQRLRAGHDAILVGGGTARADDPLLTVRGDIEPRVPPVRIVFDGMARTSTASRLLRTADMAPVWIVAGEDAPVERVEALCAAGARVLAAPVSRGRIEIGPALRLLRAEGVRSILCEGGGMLGAALLEAGAVGRLYLFIAPDLYGPAGSPAFPLESAGPDFGLRSIERLGCDALLVLDRTGEEN